MSAPTAPRRPPLDSCTFPEGFTRLTASMRLDGGDVLPGLSVRVGGLFELPTRPAAGKGGKKEGSPPGKANGRRGRK
jgi:hypothetical protein